MGILDHRGGSAGLVAAAAMPAVLAVVLLAVDFGSAAALRSGLQNAADAAALAGARELMIVRDGRGSIAETTATMLANDMAAALPVERGSVVASAHYDDAATTLNVSITAKAQGILAPVVLGEPMTVGVTSSALPVGDRSLCVMGLAEDGVSIDVRDRSAIQANGCTVHANSTGTQSLTVLQRGRVSAAGVCTAGGYRGVDTAVTPAPTEDCPGKDDPLRARPKPAVGGCDYNNRELRNANGETWSPGVYCGGMEVTNGARLTLNPGVYIIKGGSLVVKNGSSLVGDGVTFFLTDGARLDIQNNSRISLRAPAGGLTAGMLFFGDSASPPIGSAHQLLSNDAPMLLGTVYLPNATLQIGANRPIADQSPWTALVADRVALTGAAAVVLNSRFDETDVPLPSGLDGGARNIRLTQ